MAARDAYQSGTSWAGTRRSFSVIVKQTDLYFDRLKANISGGRSRSVCNTQSTSTGLFTRSFRVRTNIRSSDQRFTASSQQSKGSSGKGTGCHPSTHFLPSAGRSFAAMSVPSPAITTGSAPPPRPRTDLVISYASGRSHRPWNMSIQTARSSALSQTTSPPSFPSVVSKAYCPSSTRTFTLFLLLPPELQLHIWTLVFLERRVVPLYSAPFTHTSRCALLRFLRASGPGYVEVPTEAPQSLKSAPFACRASYDIYKRLYHRIMVMRSDRKMVHVKFNPRQDVVFFKMGLSSKIHTALSLEAIVGHQPEVVKCSTRIAVETIGDVTDFARVLKGFDMLEELVIVLPAVRKVGDNWNFSDVAGNEDSWDQRAWELGLKIVTTLDTDDLKSKVEKTILDEMKRLKNEKWSGWKFPNVRAVENWEDMLES